MSSKTKTTSTKEEAKPALVPKLRFLEFREMPSWSETTVGRISDTVIAGGTPSTSEKKFWGGDIRWMNSGELNDKKVSEVQGRITLEGLNNSSTKRIPPRCVLIGLAGQGKTRGTVAMNFVELCTNQSIAAIFPNDSAFNSDFLYHDLDKRYDELRRLSAGGEGRGGLNLQIIKSLKVALPAPAEQQKIAECLSSVDELMAAQARKVDALKTHKKGLMQQLFPREGETQPRLRFPEFKKDGPWKLGNIGSMLAETQRPIELSDHAEYRLVTVKRRYGGLISRGNMKGHEILVKTQFEVRNRDFLISKRQIVHNACGLVPEELEGSVVSNEYSVLTPKSGCSIDFFWWFAMQPSVSASFMSCSVGIVIEKMLFKLPAWLKQEFLFPSLPEQRRIATCLSSLDALITAETQKHEALKTHKKGLMQQLFPSSEKQNTL